MRGFFACVAALLVCGPPSHAPCFGAAGRAFAADAPSYRVKNLADWIEAARAHEPGEVDRPALVIGAWPNGQIKLLWLDVQTLIRFVRCPTCGIPAVGELGVDRRVNVDYQKADLAAIRTMAAALRERPSTPLGAGQAYNEILKRGAILHADIAMLVQPASQTAAAAGAIATPTMILKGQDGVPDRLDDGGEHWNIGRALLDLVGGTRPAPQDDATVRAWYYATVAYLHINSLHLVAHFERALQLFPGDPEIQFQSGCLHETLASPRVQSILRTATLPTGFVLNIRNEQAELQASERFFRRALELKPDHAEARLRLGRVLGRLGRHADAAVELRQVSDNVDHAIIRYYTALFLGGEEAALGRREQARAAYERAAAIYPLAQSPQLALSHLARESGDRGGALQSIQHVLDLPPEEEARRDPYWIYHVVEGRHQEALLNQLYRPFRRREGPGGR